MNKHIDNIVKSINRHKKGLRDPQIMHPEREWSIGMFLAALIFVASASWSLSVYLENRNAAVAPPEEEQSESVVYRESMVEEALGRIEDRASTLSSLLPRGAETVTEAPEEVVEDEEAATSTESEPEEPMVEEVIDVEADGEGVLDFQ